MENQKRRVVVTGMGAITPLGNDVESTWQALKTGKSGIVRNDRFDISEFPSKIAGLVRDFEPNNYMEKKDARKMALFTQYGVAAARQAMDQAGFTSGNFDPDRASVFLGNGIGGFEIIESSYRILFSKGPSRVPPLTIPKLISNEGPANVAMVLGLKGPCQTITTACASGSDAIGAAVASIRSGRSDIAVTGGTEGCITELGIAGFCILQTLSTKYNDDPTRASRPFDKNRDGFVIAEGAGVLVLEELEHAKARGAKILAELAGYGASCDAYHLTSPEPEGEGAAKAMRLAMEDGNLRPEDIDYVNAHGTSTPTNDPIETRAIKKALGERARDIPVTSTKSMTGHLVGAAGGLETIISVLTIRDGFVPGTINLEEADPECDLNYLPGKGKEMKVRATLSNSLGFGGHNAVVAVKEWKE
ncbi:beta-ketoacyl-ACP synthase II [Sediminispirochaeta smaragdinae]|uniref:3-oxoacyl-[acyl-carrier-protein] synthase 2 n=1 Tax=Sediminispirochaeta smaragdinae (strain DSM 11293 / JCM 15392 / SEBR 4228) TaxID=573413 RepID=E1R1N9_SEDSS|nr:beta-ketoacyl-ACP synthase II [Sediminispirochaeta smaragdinae]ADK81415.1 3-oxoacyl-(acyl-carrier-protein) synthase 2 [Sediminispirochaeta smaragdinae DSM 11293]